MDNKIFKGKMHPITKWCNKNGVNLDQQRKLKVFIDDLMEAQRKDEFTKKKLDAKIEKLESKIMEAIGWAVADCRAILDDGGDPRKSDIDDVIYRAIRDLNLDEL